MSDTQKRITPTGFIQYKEGKGEPWRFYISSFDATSSGQDGFCNVLHQDGLEQVSIDKDDRILIEGKRYGRKFWNH